MKCPMCGETMKTVNGTYKYVESGLNNIILTGVPLHKCSCGEAMPEIRNIEGLHRVIANALVKKKTPLSGREVRFIRKEMRCSAKELALMLGVSPVTVSRWENETEKIGMVSDKLIRMIYIQTVQEKCHKVLEGTVSQIKAIKSEDGQKPIRISIPSLNKYDTCLSYT
ncbi:MAG: helix-turn-helix domain-containing protein [Alphaproteobacteria bacterium]|uniref:Helix-turn-helix domain-containing protein n=1 Tax=Candidatus Nitrobium versatile TaxID=2884831 RepID=A0A953M2U2_9BACT|nr:helix-turn-helix domain-containing protein [Candidatus Nitrobium versatile]